MPPLHVELVSEHAGPPEPIPKDDLFGYMPAFARRLEQRWLARPPDVVHAHFWMFGWAAARAARGLPLALTFHALGAVKTHHQGAADTSPPQRQAVEAALADRADAVVATCDDEVRELVGQGADTDRITVVPCGVHPTLFRPSGAVVAGGPADRAGLAADPEVRRLRTIAAACGLTERVRFLGGVPRDQVPPLIRSADVVVAVGRLLAHRSLRDRMGQAGAALVRDRFTWPQVARSTLDVYRRLARKNERWAVSA